MAYPLRRLSIIGTACCLILCGAVDCTKPNNSGRTHRQRIVVIGFDGMDPTLVSRWMASGLLPNLSRLAHEGTFAVLGSPPPVESPVAWSTFATGLNPGKHNVFDFVVRDPERYSISGDLYRLAPQRFMFGWIPLPPGKPVGRRQGVPFWKVADDDGVRATVLTVPMTYPPDELRAGHILAGFPAPDLLGTVGTYQYWGTDVSVVPNTSPGGGIAHRLSLDGDVVETELTGPIDPARTRTRLHAPLILRWNREMRSVHISVENQALDLREGEWTDWVHLTFKVNALLSFHGMIQFRLLRASDELELFGTPLNVDPAEPLREPLTSPRTFAAELAQRLGGAYRTVGWAEFADRALRGGYVDDQVFMEDANRAFTDRERIVMESLRQPSWDLFVSVIETTDRVSHMMWRLMDRSSPLYDSSEAARYGDSIRQVYERADRLVGRILTVLPKDAVLIIVSDHGFQSFRRAVNLNAWLEKHGLLAVRASPDGHRAIDWSRTSAYAFGLGQLYINQRGRERDGIVTEGPAKDRLIDEIRRQLLGLVDPKDGRRVMLDVYRGDDVYKGPFMANAPDLVVGLNAGFRIGFADATGMVSESVIDDNLERWSGDHCGLASNISGGVLFMNIRAKVANPQITDVAPTILRLLQVRIPSDIDGTPLM